MGSIEIVDLVNYLVIKEGTYTIMYFLAHIHVDNSFRIKFNFTKNNIYGTHVLLETCKVTGSSRRFNHVIIDEAYGETEHDALNYAMHMIYSYSIRNMVVD